MATLTSMSQLGNNQMSSQFGINFASIPGTPDHDLIDLTNRASTQGFAMPTKVSATYDLFIRGVKGTFPSPLDETDKTFTISILLDAGWKQHDAFATWKRLVYDDETGKAGALEDITTTVSISFYGALQNDPTTASKVIYFEGAFINSIKITDTDPQSNEPTRIECEFKFRRMKDLPEATT